MTGIGPHFWNDRILKLGLPHLGGGRILYLDYLKKWSTSRSKVSTMFAFDARNMMFKLSFYLPTAFERWKYRTRDPGSPHLKNAKGPLWAVEHLFKNMLPNPIIGTITIPMHIVTFIKNRRFSKKLNPSQQINLRVFSFKLQPFVLLEP